jgi:hypothetical protein
MLADQELFNAKTKQINGYHNSQQEEKNRLKLKFNKAKKNYQVSKRLVQLKQGSQEKNKKKVARMLTTCPQALKLLLAKTSLNSHVIDTTAVDEDEGYSNCGGESASNAVGFSVDFVKYYLDREKKLKQLKSDLNLLKQNQFDMTKREKELRSQYEKKVAEHKRAVEKNKQCSKDYKTIGSIIELIWPVTIKNSKNPLKPSPKPKKRAKSTEVRVNNNNDSMLSTRKKSLKNTEKIPFNLDLNSSCCICAEKTNSHLLIDCDTCQKIYHISCLDPPMSKLPKKTKLFGWECVFCVDKKNTNNNPDDDSQRETNDTISANRSLRRQTKKPTRFDTLSSSDGRQNKRKSTNTSRKSLQKDLILADNVCQIVARVVSQSSISISDHNHNHNNDDEYIYIQDDDDDDHDHITKASQVAQIVTSSSSSYELLKGTKKIALKKRNSVDLTLTSVAVVGSASKRSRSSSTNHSFIPLSHSDFKLTKTSPSKSKTNCLHDENTPKEAILL